MKLLQKTSNSSMYILHCSRLIVQPIAGHNVTDNLKARYSCFAQSYVALYALCYTLYCIILLTSLTETKMECKCACYVCINNFVKYISAASSLDWRTNSVLTATILGHGRSASCYICQPRWHKPLPTAGCSCATLPLPLWVFFDQWAWHWVTHWVTSVQLSAVVVTLYV